MTPVITNYHDLVNLWFWSFQLSPKAPQWLCLGPHTCTFLRTPIHPLRKPHYPLVSESVTCPRPSLVYVAWTSWINLEADTWCYWFQITVLWDLKFRRRNILTFFNAFRRRNVDIDSTSNRRKSFKFDVDSTSIFQRFLFGVEKELKNRHRNIDVKSTWKFRLARC